MNFGFSIPHNTVCDIEEETSFKSNKTQVLIVLGHVLPSATTLLSLNHTNQAVKSNVLNTEETKNALNIYLKK